MGMLSSRGFERRFRIVEMRVSRFTKMVRFPIRVDGVYLKVVMI